VFGFLVILYGLSHVFFGRKIIDFTIALSIAVGPACAVYTEGMKLWSGWKEKVPIFSKCTGGYFENKDNCLKTQEEVDAAEVTRNAKITGMQWAVYGAALLAFIVTFSIVKWCLQEMLPLLLGACVGSCCLPIIVFILWGVIMNKPGTASVLSMVALPLGYCLGCIFGKRLDRIIRGFMTALIGA
jgi:hypothetical protein